ncbi:MAG: hypothetical protein KBD29_04250 [Candidatus Magasanikbacteria bacterium]|nr:hypothetical protein [Candidatus Magasanikbacteria bacterium]
MPSINEVKDILFKWQELSGAIIGASTPIIIALIGLYLRRKSRHKEKLKQLDRTLVLAIKTTIESKATLENFFLKVLKPYVENGFIPDQKYQLDLVFIPAVVGTGLSLDVKDIDSGSGYIDSNILLCLALSRDFELSLSDSRRQLGDTYQLYKELALSGKVTPQEQVGHLKNAITSFSEAFYNILVKHNAQVLSDKLIQTKIALDYFQSHPLLWRLKFTRSFRLYKNQVNFENGMEEIFKKIDDFFLSKFTSEQERVRGSMEDFMDRADKVRRGDVV